VEHIRISDCSFGLGYGALTLGSEACQVRDVVMENCRMKGPQKNCLARLKLRPDTAQWYQDIHFRNITLDGPGTFISIEPWLQYFDLKGQPAPTQRVENVTFENISGSTTRFGKIAGSTNSVVSGISLKNIALTVTDTNVVIQNVRRLQMEGVKINGVAVSAARTFSVSPAPQ
jgi:polygalacturonase